MKTAIVTGITGQDGSYLAEFLLAKGYHVIGCQRRSSTNTQNRIQHLLNHTNFKIEEFDLTDPSGCSQLINHYKPQELYNLAAQSHVGTSFKQPTTTFEIDTIGVVNLLEAIKTLSPATKFYQASTSEMFGCNFTTNNNGLKYQDENTELMPQSPYGVAKTASHRMVQIYRAAYNLFSCSGILFNHESPRRGENFVTRKITKWIGEFVRWQNNQGIDNDIAFSQDHIHINKNTFPKLRLGNLEAFRDWGYAGDYVEAMWLMLQQDVADDYVICTGETHTIREFLDASFEHVGILDWSNYVVQDPEFYRPAEVDYLMGSNAKAKEILKWEPKTSFQELAVKMLEHDLGQSDV